MDKAGPKRSVALTPLVAHVVIGSTALGEDGQGYQLLAERFGLKRSPAWPTWQATVNELRRELEALQDMSQRVKDRLFAETNCLSSASWICKEGHALLLEFCIAKRGFTSINVLSAAGRALLHIAAKYGRGEVTRRLLAHGATVDLEDHFGRTALHLAAKFGNTFVARVLLEHGAKIDRRGVFKNTPLHSAAKHRSEAMVEVLLNNGAEINAANEAGWTALMIAATGDDGGVVADIELMQLLIRRGANVDARSNTGTTALILAACQKNADAIELLLDNGADVDAQDSCTALMAAVWADNLPVARMLLRYGADVTKRDNDGDTALAQALHCNDAVKEEMCDLLRRYGA